MGLFSYLLVLGYWKSERCIKWYLLVHRSAIYLEILFWKNFWKHGKAPRITLSRHSSCISLPGQCLPLIFPTTTSLCGAQGRIRTGHTCILFIVKSKSGSMEKQVMHSRSKGASVWMDRWMNGGMAYSWSRKHEEILTRVTKFDRTQQNDKQHMYKVSHSVWHMALVGLAYHWGTCLF